MPTATPDAPDPAPAPVALGQRGELRASIALDAAGMSRIARLETVAPLRIAKPFRRTDGGLDACVMECSPGMLAGDEAVLEWDLAAGTRLHVGTQSSQRVHPAELGVGARQRQHARVADGALFALVPEPVLPFAGADWHSTTRIDVAGTGLAIVAEGCSAGRIAHGERLAFRCWEASLDIRLDGRLVAASHQLVRPAEAPHPAAPGQLGQAGAWGSMHVVGGALDEPACTALLAELQAAIAAWSSDGTRAGGQAAAQPLPSHGIAIHALAPTSWDLMALLRSCEAIATRAHWLLRK